MQKQAEKSVPQEASSGIKRVLTGYLHPIRYETASDFLNQVLRQRAPHVRISVVNNPPVDAQAAFPFQVLGDQGMTGRGVALHGGTSRIELFARGADGRGITSALPLAGRTADIPGTQGSWHDRCLLRADELKDDLESRLGEGVTVSVVTDDFLPVKKEYMDSLKARPALSPAHIDSRWLVFADPMSGPVE